MVLRRTTFTRAAEIQETIKPMTQHLTYFLGIGIFITTVGCGKKEDDEETVVDLCREQCDLSADACPDDSYVGQSAEICRVLCGAFETSDSCYEKFEAYMNCLANEEPACDVLTFSEECEDEAAPFVIETDGTNRHGECVAEGVTTAE